MQEEVLCNIELSKIINAPGEVRITFFENGREKSTFCMPKHMVGKAIEKEWNLKYSGQVPDHKSVAARRNPFLVSDIDIIKPT